MKNVAVLMAGGRSERLWPMSRVALPKQFLPITKSDRTMIQMTVDRLGPLVALEDVYVVTSRDYIDIVRAQLPDLPAANILAEPEGRNTAPCVALATAVLRQRYRDAVMLVLASDHLIEREEEFIKNLQAASGFAAREEALVTIGITPTYPETGYGYIQFDKTARDSSGLFPVKRFVEKPNLERAALYLQSGEYLWNSGMFVWRLSVVADAFERYMPEVYQGMGELESAVADGTLEEVLPRVFATFPSVSIDYGIMEKAERIYLVPSTFTWLDVGNWNAMTQILPMDEWENATHGNSFLLDAKHNIVYSSTGRVVSLIGAENMIVVDTDDVLMILPRDKADSIKPALSQLRKEGRNTIL